MKDPVYHMASNASIDDWRDKIIPIREAVGITKNSCGIGLRQLQTLIMKAVRHHRGETEGFEDQQLLRCLYQKHGKYYLDKQGIQVWSEQRDKPQSFLKEDLHQ